MITDLSKAKELLAEKGCTCVLCKDGLVFASFERGVKPLMKWILSETNFKGFSAADKVIGKATAFLYIKLQVKAVFASVISKPALELLQEYGIEVYKDTVVQNIINRTGDGICPFESAVLDITDKEKAFELIRLKMQEMGIKL